jgi:hypothetical protein
VLLQYRSTVPLNDTLELQTEPRPGGQ